MFRTRRRTTTRKVKKQCGGASCMIRSMEGGRGKRKTMRRDKKRGGCGCMLRKSGGYARKSRRSGHRRQHGGDGLETTDFKVQGIPTTDDDNSVIVIGDYGPVTAKQFQEIMEDREAGRLD